jgi:outer membrane protein, multidrug efflux system
MKLPGAERAFTLVLVATAGTMLASCMGPSNYEGPQMALSDHYSLAPSAQVSARANPAWWTAFEDQTLNALIAHALGQNLTIAEARARVRESEALARRAGVQTADMSADVTVASGGGDKIGLNLATIFSPGRRAEIKAARARLDAERNAETNARRLVFGELAQAYADLRYFQVLLTYRQQDLRSRQRTLNDIRSQFDVQEATRLDILRAEALLAQTRAEIPEVEAQVYILRSRIATLLGEAPGLAGVSLDAGGGQLVPHGASNIGVPADLLRARPDVRQAEREYAAAVSDLSAAKAARYPSLSLAGVIQAPLDGGQSAESLELGFTLPIFAQPALAATVTVAEARVDLALLGWKKAVLNAVDEVESALLALAAAQRSVSASADVVRLNQEALDLSRRLFVEGGQSTVLEVLDRERALSEARAALAQAQRNVAQNYIRLYTALGLEDGLDAPDNGKLASAAVPPTTE